jgi:hypothetical protein
LATVPADYRGAQQFFFGGRIASVHALKTVLNRSFSDGPLPGLSYDVID